MLRHTDVAVVVQARERRAYQRQERLRRQPKDSPGKAAAAIEAASHHLPKGVTVDFVPEYDYVAFPRLNEKLPYKPSAVSRGLLILLDPLCRWCMKRPTTTVDHIIPRCRGGRDSMLNTVGSCRECNSLKADFTPKELGWKLHLPLRAFTIAERFGTTDPTLAGKPWAISSAD